MPLEYRTVCRLPNGMHARPASRLEAMASRFPAEIILVNERTGMEASAKSVLALISADIRSGDPLLLRVSGSEAQAAFGDLARYLRDDQEDDEEPLPPADLVGDRPRIPRSLQAAAPAQMLRGTVQCRGLAEGVIKQMKGLRFSQMLQDKIAAGTVSPVEEAARLQRALAAVQLAIGNEIAASNGPAAEILRAHAALLRDATFAENIASILQDNSTTLADAILSTIEKFSSKLGHSSSAYLRERALDLQDVGARLLREIYGADALAAGPVLDCPTILAAESLTPGQLLGLDREHLRGLVLQHAGATSHTIILARSFGLPTLVGVDEIAILQDESPAILDANLGLLLIEPNEATRRYYALENRRIERVAARARAFIPAAGASRDGHRLAIMANVISAEEVGAAVGQGAEGIGLFRTEMLFMDRAAAPSEEEQTAVYVAAVKAAQGRPVTFRTFDIGGDKPVPYLHLPPEANPFLGYRGARLYQDFSELLKSQLRAILQASAHGSIRIMAPMISCPEEMQSFRAVVEESRTELALPEVPVGMMIEVPSAAFAIAAFAAHADFFSVGSNDLLQYFFAADRDNARVSGLSSAFHPSFVSFLRHIVRAVHAAGKPLSLCGELGEKSDVLPMLLGLGFDSISLAAPRIPAIKEELATLEFNVCESQIDDLLQCSSRAAVEVILQDSRRQIKAPPLLARELIVTDSSGLTKHEVIKELIDLLVAANRLHDPIAVEEAIWRREETYSTGFDYGVAVPHCQSADVRASSIAVVRLQTPVAWGALDEQPVGVVILLALRSEDKGREHLRIFARLSRLIMNEDFRERLLTAPDGSALFSLLESELTPPPTA